MSARSDRSGKAVTFLDDLFVESRAELLSQEQKRRERLAAEADRRREAFHARKRATDEQMLRQRQPFAVARAAGRIQRPPIPKQPSLYDDKKAGFVYADERLEPPANAMLDLDRFDHSQRESEKDQYAAQKEAELAQFVIDNSDSD